jgi:hypothetical protein
MAFARLSRLSDSVHTDQPYSETVNELLADELGRGRTSPDDAWKEIIADAGLSGDVCIHVMRHTCCTLLLAMGMCVDDAAEYVGMHPQTFRRTYGHSTGSGARRVAAFIDGAGMLAALPVRGWASPPTEVRKDDTAILKLDVLGQCFEKLVHRHLCRMASFLPDCAPTSLPKSEPIVPTPFLARR